MSMHHVRDLTQYFSSTSKTNSESLGMKVELKHWQKRGHHQRQSFTDQSMQDRNGMFNSSSKNTEAVHLCRTHTVQNNNEASQIVLRRMYNEPVCSELHMNVVHLGLNRTLQWTKTVALHIIEENIYFSIYIYILIYSFFLSFYIYFQIKVLWLIDAYLRASSK